MREKLSVAAARVDAGHTQRSMAKVLNICVDTYRKYEKHPENMPIALVAAFCKAVERSPDDVIFLP